MYYNCLWDLGSAWYMRASAFSLIELVVVIAIVALLAAVAVPTYKRYLQRTEVEKIVWHLNSILDRVIIKAQQGDVSSDDFLPKVFSSLNLTVDNTYANSPTSLAFIMPQGFISGVDNPGFHYTSLVSTSNFGFTCRGSKIETLMQIDSPPDVSQKTIILGGGDTCAVRLSVSAAAVYANGVYKKLITYGMDDCANEDPITGHIFPNMLNNSDPADSTIINDFSSSATCP
jgi:prepilin-type N-terminal cleavage/methylation domain-containing protein